MPKCAKQAGAKRDGYTRKIQIYFLTNILQANVGKILYFLLFEIPFLILEIPFLISEMDFLIFKVHNWCEAEEAANLIPVIL